MKTPKHKANTQRDPKALRSETTLMPWLIWFLAVLFYAYEFTQRVSVSVYLPYLLKDLALSTSAVGIMSSCFYWAYLAMQIPGGILIDRFGARRLATAGVLLVSLGSFILANMHGVLIGSLARLIVGFGAAFAFICAMQLIIIWFPPYRFALLAGLTNFAGYIGATIGQVPLTNAVQAFGWRETALASTLVGIVIAVLIAFFVHDKPYSTRQKYKKKQKARKQASADTARHIFQGLKKILENPLNWLNGLYAAFMMGATSAFAALWGVQFLTISDHFTKTIAAGATSSIFIGVAVGSPIFGWLSEYLKKRQILLVIAAAGAFICTTLIIFFNRHNIALVYALCFLFGFFQSAHVLNFAIGKDINTKKYSGSVMGFINMMALLGGACLQPIVGIILDWSQRMNCSNSTVFTTHNLHSALVIIPVCQLIALVIALCILSDKTIKKKTVK